MEKTDLIKRVDRLLEQGSQVLATRQDADYGEIVDLALLSGFRTAVLSFIQCVYGDDHTHYKEFKKQIDIYDSSLSKAEIAIATLRVIKEEIEGGWLFTIRGLITSEVFTCFLDMAEHFLEKGYKDPAAVMGGSVLEEHLRQLCVANNVDVEEEKHDKVVPIKADRLNSDLRKAGVYKNQDQKEVTAWLGLRNNAAHGKYDEYTEEQVRNMLQGITDFMNRISV